MVFLGCIQLGIQWTFCAFERRFGGNGVSWMTAHGLALRAVYVVHELE